MSVWRNLRSGRGHCLQQGMREAVTLGSGALKDNSMSRVYYPRGHAMPRLSPTFSNETQACRVHFFPCLPALANAKKSHCDLFVVVGQRKHKLLRNDLCWVPAKIPRHECSWPVRSGSESLSSPLS